MNVNSPWISRYAPIPHLEQSVSHPVPSTTLNPLVSEFIPKSVTATTTSHSHTQSVWMHNSTICNSHVPVNPCDFQAHGASLQARSIPDVSTKQIVQNSSMEMIEFAKIISDQMNLSRLPIPEPPVFSGDPLKYPDWKVTFEALIERRAIPHIERMLYLEKYLSGPARKAVEG